MAEIVHTFVENSGYQHAASCLNHIEYQMAADVKGSQSIYDFIVLASNGERT